jgi:hypothetical protein
MQIKYQILRPLYGKYVTYIEATIALFTSKVGPLLGAYIFVKFVVLWGFPTEAKARQSIRQSFLAAFARFRKATIAFVMSVRQSIRMEQTGSHGMDFNEC